MLHFSNNLNIEFDESWLRKSPQGIKKPRSINCDNTNRKYQMNQFSLRVFNLKKKCQFKRCFWWWVHFFILLIDAKWYCNFLDTIAKLRHLGYMLISIFVNLLCFVKIEVRRIKKNISFKNKQKLLKCFSVFFPTKWFENRRYKGSWKSYIDWWVGVHGVISPHAL